MDAVTLCPATNISIKACRSTLFIIVQFQSRITALCRDSENLEREIRWPCTGIVANAALWSQLQSSAHPSMS